MDLLATRNNKHCSKCGSTKQSGKQSCCARGGAWFENCGDVGDTQFDHTWAEGIQACKGIGSLISAKSSLQGILHHVEHNAYPVINAKPQNTITRERMLIYHPGSVRNVSNMDSGDCASPTKALVCTLSLFIISNLQE